MLAHEARDRAQPAIECTRWDDGERQPDGRGRSDARRLRWRRSAARSAPRTRRARRRVVISQAGLDRARFLGRTGDEIPPGAKSNHVTRSVAARPGRRRRRPSGDRSSARCLCCAPRTPAGGTRHPPSVPENRHGDLGHIDRHPRAVTRRPARRLRTSPGPSWSILPESGANDPRHQPVATKTICIVIVAPLPELPRHAVSIRASARHRAIGFERSKRTIVARQLDDAARFRLEGQPVRIDAECAEACGIRVGQGPAARTTSTRQFRER